MPPDVPEGSIVITPKEFYDGVRSDITEIKAAVLPLPDLKIKVDRLELRTNALEKRVWMATGFASAAGFGLSFLAQFLMR